ncbi:hypothetical protein AOQ84DRAFT_384390, partial [Glonium stellatum]
MKALAPRSCYFDSMPLLGAALAMARGPEGVLSAPMGPSVKKTMRISVSRLGWLTVWSIPPFDSRNSLDVSSFRLPETKSTVFTTSSKAVKHAGLASVTDGVSRLGRKRLRCIWYCSGCNYQIFTGRETLGLRVLI